MDEELCETCHLIKDECECCEVCEQTEDECECHECGSCGELVEETYQGICQGCEDDQTIRGLMYQ